MDRERWLCVERLFHAASDLPAEQRLAWLQGATRSDAALRGEVEALLRADANAEGMLGHIVGRAWLEYVRARASWFDDG